MTINDRLKQVRKALNLTTTQLAETISYSQATVSLVENAKPPYNNPEKIADSYIRLFSFAFNVNENWLRTGEGAMFNEEPRGLPREALAAQIMELVDKVSTDELRALVKDFLKALIVNAVVTRQDVQKIIEEADKAQE